MFLFFAAAAIFTFFVPFIVLAARSSDESKKMRARFAMLQSGGAGGLSSGGLDLFKSAEEQSTGWADVVVAWLSSQFELPMILIQANSQTKPKTLVLTCFFAALGGIAISFLSLHNLLVAMLAGTAGGYAPVLLLRMRGKRRVTAMNKVLPDVVDMISRALRAGHSMPAAIGIVAEEAREPARSGFGEVFQKQKFGLPLRDAAMELIQQFPSQDLKVLVTAILVQGDTGGNLVQILERTAAVIRERLKLEGEVRVHTAQGRMTGWILCLLPVLMLGMLAMTNPAYPKVLLEDPMGRKLLYAGVVLLCLGTFLIQRIVKKIEV